MSNSWKKLADGSWGVLTAVNNSATIKAGDTVTVTNRAGESKSVVLGERAGQWQGWPIFAVAPTPRTPAAAQAVGEMDGVLALFAKAKTHLKRPAIVLSVPEVDQTNDLEGWGIRLTIAGERAKVPGSITVTTEAYETTNDYGEP